MKKLSKSLGKSCSIEKTSGIFLIILTFLPHDANCRKIFTKLNVENSVLPLLTSQLISGTLKKTFHI